MVKRSQLFLRGITVLVALTITVVAQAQNKVVVIPMAGDEINIMPKPFAPLTKQSPPGTDYTGSMLTIVDKITGLEWQRQNVVTTSNWDDAFQYCADDDLDGKTDWRLPFVAELQSIVDYGTFDPSINAVAFPSANSSFYWSASSRASSSGSAWFVDFNNGVVNSGLKTVSNFVRCVR